MFTDKKLMGTPSGESLPSLKEECLDRSSAPQSSGHFRMSKALQTQAEKGEKRSEKGEREEKAKIRKNRERCSWDSWERSRTDFKTQSHCAHLFGFHLLLGIHWRWFQLSKPPNTSRFLDQLSAPWSQMNRNETTYFVYLRLLISQCLYMVTASGTNTRRCRVSGTCWTCKVPWWLWYTMHHFHHQCGAVHIAMLGCL